MEEAIIKIEHVSKKFKEQIVLADVNLEILKGMIYGIVGRNGSGKTVLFKCICGFMRPTEGTITVEGKKVGKGNDIPEHIGIIIESPGFLPHYSAYKNLKLLASMEGKIDSGRIREVIKKVGLDPESKKRVSKYSMGMRQRLGIAQAIMGDPPILILDEPMNGLDNSGVGEMRRLLLELKSEGCTLLIASHNQDDIRILCDEVYYMDRGRLSTKPGVE